MSNRARAKLTTEQRRGRMGRPWRELQERVFGEESHCALCRGWVDQALEPNHLMARSVHHLVPLTHGGAPLDRANARLAHRLCNQRLGNRIAPTIESIDPRAW